LDVDPPGNVTIIVVEFPGGITTGFVGAVVPAVV
jgi:hypothetical protein